MRAPQRPSVAFAGSFLVLFVLGASWSLASPLMSAPDEASHLVRAAAVARLQWLGHDDDSGPYTVTWVEVPQVFDSAWALPSCYAFRGDVTAGCAPSMSGSSSDARVHTTAGAYPPLYYAIVGLPSLVLASQRGVYAMRVVSAALSAALLACAFQAIFDARRRRSLLAGVLVATTPVAVYFGAVINPSGMEIAGAIGLWCSLLVALDDPPAVQLRRAHVRVAITGATLACARPIAPFWLVLIVACCTAVCGVRALRRFVSTRSGVAAVAAVGLAALGTTVWVLATGALTKLAPGEPSTFSTFHDFVFALGRTGDLYEEAIAVVGWLDTQSVVAIVAVTVALAGVLYGAVAAGPRRQLVALVGLVVAVVVIPVLLDAPRAATDGFIWRGRYSLPLAVGVPIVAGFIAGRRDRDDEPVARRTLVLTAVLVGVAHVAAFAWALRRYRVGVGFRSPLNFITDGDWSPPVPTAALLVAMLVAVVAGGAWLLRLSAPTVHASDAAAPSTRC